jgi:hypothetical protein
MAKYQVTWGTHVHGEGPRHAAAIALHEMRRADKFPVSLLVTDETGHVAIITFQDIEDESLSETKEEHTINGK